MSNINWDLPVTTRDGRPVEIITMKGRHAPVLGYIADEKELNNWRENGSWDWSGGKHPRDLIQAPPWKLPDPPAGKHWHRDDWTQEMLPEGWRPLLKDEQINAGDECLRWDGKSWYGCGTGGTPLAHHRTKRPLPPERKTVPWTFGTRPKGMVWVMHNTCWGNERLITEWGSIGVETCGTIIRYEELLTDWKQRDGLPCGTEVES